MDDPFSQMLRSWRLPEGATLHDRINQMIRPPLCAGHFGSSRTMILADDQYHLGGRQDTRELADLAALRLDDRVLDVCCFLGGPARQLAEEQGCPVTGIDISRRAIAAARRITDLAELGDRVRFCVGDAARLPFRDAAFTVVWNQCSLDRKEVWLREFDRVLAPAGRLALTFEIWQHYSGSDNPKWSLADLSARLSEMGYAVEHCEDITERDIEIGWKALDQRLSQHELEFAEALGEQWVRDTHAEFADNIEKMRAGLWGNGRIVAVKGAGTE